MKRKFNTQGICVANKHYMVDISNKIDKIMELIEDEAYFTINKPRQYGKTTTLALLEKRLITEGYLVISISFEGIGDKVFENEEWFSKNFLENLSDFVEDENLCLFLKNAAFLEFKFKQ